MPKSDTPTKTKDQAKTPFTFNWERRKLVSHYQAELARFSTWLFPSIVVTMAFLLLGGFHNPKILFLLFMYAALGGFALSVLSYLVVHILVAQLAARTDSASAKDKAAGTKQAQGSARLAAWLKVLEVAQQVFFFIGFVAVIGFAIEVSLLFFPAAAAAPAGGSSSSAQSGT